MLTHMATRLASTHQSRLVCGARRPADAGHEHRFGSSAQRYRSQAVRHERIPSSRRKSSGVSHRPSAPLQPDPLPAPGPECRQVWGRSGRRSRPDIRLDAQPANPHVRRLSMSGDGHHHVIRWNLDCAVILERAPIEGEWKARPGPLQLHHLSGCVRRSKTQAA